MQIALTGDVAIEVRADDGVVSWHRLRVDGRPAVYGVGGPPGPPVVFLHGWALGSRAYKRALRRLIRRGCRVYAPALPSFGGTADLPRGRGDIASYGAWVASFMDAVGISDPALVIGHSFGGGVGVKLAHDAPDKVNYLILLNAVGGVAPRPPWAWAAGLAREMWPPRQALDTVDAMREDLVPNLIRNPLGLARAGVLARDADLRAELAALRARGLPVLALTSDHDDVIPRTGFDAVCSAVGIDGRVVRGAHCWMLSAPDAFDAVLANVVDDRVKGHRDLTTSGRVADVLALLDGSMPARTARALISGAPPLWLLSDDAAALAADLALCHPKPARGEVRAVAQPILESSLVRLTVATADRPGLLADSASVLAANRLSIREASAATWPSRQLALHSFTVVLRPGDAGFDWDRLGRDLISMVQTGVTPPPPFAPRGSVEVRGDDVGDGRTLVHVRARDQVGLLAAICGWFAQSGLNVETVHARTAGKEASDQFIVTGPFDRDKLSQHLGGA